LTNRSFGNRSPFRKIIGLAPFSIELMLLNILGPEFFLPFADPSWRLFSNSPVPDGTFVYVESAPSEINIVNFQCNDFSISFLRATCTGKLIIFRKMLCDLISTLWRSSIISKTFVAHDPIFFLSLKAGQSRHRIESNDLVFYGFASSLDRSGKSLLCPGCIVISPTGRFFRSFLFLVIPDLASNMSHSSARKKICDRCVFN